MKNVTYKFCYVLTLLRVNFVIINFEIINFVTEPFRQILRWTTCQTKVMSTFSCFSCDNGGGGGGIGMICLGET
jgi:hypothetical protein